MSKDLHELSASELSEAYKSRDISPVEVTQSCLGAHRGLGRRRSTRSVWLTVREVSGWPRNPEARWNSG